MGFKQEHKGQANTEVSQEQDRKGTSLFKRKDQMNGLGENNAQNGLIQSSIPTHQAVVQGKWIFDATSNKNLNLQATDDPKVYYYGKTGKNYRVTKWKGNEPVEVELDDEDDSSSSDEMMDEVHSSYRHDKWDPYKNWTKESEGVSIQTEFGPVSAFQNRGAPKIGSKKTDYEKVDLGDSYAEYVEGLRSGKQTDQDIAQDLLDLDDNSLKTALEKRAAAMLHTTVYLGEEWRKQGAAKIYRGFLRLIAQGDKTFDDFLNEFLFIDSADKGRYMASRFKDVKNKDKKVSDLDSNEQDVYNAMSPINDGDFSSDEEMLDEKKLSKPRDHSKSFKDNSSNKKGFKNIW